MTWQLRHKPNPLVWWQWINKQIDKYEEACIVYSLIPRGCKDKLYPVKVKTNSVKKKIIARKRNTFMTKHGLGLKQETTWYIYGLPVLSIQSPFDTSLLSRVVNSSTYLTTGTKTKKCFSCPRAYYIRSERNFCAISPLEFVSKRLLSKRLCIETTGFLFMNSDTYDMGNRKNKDPNKRAKRRATGTTKIKFKE